MSESHSADLFAEDRAHEDLLRALCNRVFHEMDVKVSLNVRSARGGHGQACEELGLYQRSVQSGQIPAPDLLIVCIDSNCSKYARARAAVGAAVLPEFTERTVIACPDPYVERWYMADPNSFYEVVGFRPRPRMRKCAPEIYKTMLAQAILNGGHPSTLGGIEFARELALAMDLYRAGQNEPSLGHFLTDLRARVQRAKDEWGQ